MRKRLGLGVPELFRACGSSRRDADSGTGLNQIQECEHEPVSGFRVPTLVGLFARATN